jgi:MFS family permease
MSTATETPLPGTQPISYPGSGQAWYVVILLTIAYVLSFVDRYILSLLVEPIKQDLGLSDTQVGLLLGPAFAVLYVVMGLPLGWLADRWRRTWLVGIGIALWSVATIACGLAKSFWQLMAARMSVGIGEATLSPCTMSIIADSFPPERRGKPIAVYTAALSLGAGIASLIGAAVLIWAKGAPDMSFPLFGELRAWQLTFIVVGLPGLFFAGLFLLLREPPRQANTQAEKSLDTAGPIEVIKYVAARWQVFVGYVSLVCLMTIIAYSAQWFPAMFERTWGWPPEDYAKINAWVLLGTGPLTVWLSGWGSDKLTSRGYRDGPLRILLAGALIMVPAAAAAPLMPTAELAFVLIALKTIGIAMVSAVSVTALLNLTPAPVRGQTVALYYVAISLTGLVLGPMTVGLLSQWVFGEENLRYAMAVTPIIYGIVPLAFAPITWRLYMQEAAALEVG